MQAVKQYIRKELTGLYPEIEIDSFLRLILEFVCAMDYTKQMLNKHIKIDSADRSKIKEVIKRLKDFEPIQYILGETEFFDLKLKINSSVLIPRPETEELVQWILSINKNRISNIIDIGTGSGCIALALKKHLSHATVAGVDISENALEVAQENANYNKLDVSFVKADILYWENYKWDPLDVIVSNPPYIMEREKLQMLPNVLKYEPDNALFVPNIDPLIFYRRIAEFAKVHLCDKGELFFEINENLEDQMTDLLKGYGFKNILAKKDIYGKVRMMRSCYNK